MSTTIDERVVSMQFDNARFEQNAQKTLSTLDKLKEKLNLSKSADSLQNLTRAASSFSLHGIEKAVETVHNKFTAFEVMSITALANITNKAVNAGERITKALTVEPVFTGFEEYETKIGSVQTILSNTASKGTTIEDVTKALDELNAYADMTIYNFAQMTRNIGTFTAAGVELEIATKSIQGIANLAAASGSTSQQASTAMYQLSQAIAAGAVKLQDWNSVVNAGMGGEKFQEALKQTAKEFGTDVDSIIENAGSFRASLEKGWITADVLTTTLQKFTRKGAKEYNEQMLLSGQYTLEQAEALEKEADAMEDAATAYTTFSSLWSGLKETAQSGWSQTWETVIGDFVHAKEFLSELGDRLQPVVEKMSEARNKLLELALGSKWDNMVKKINEAGIKTEEFEAAVREAADKSGYNTEQMITWYGSLSAAFEKGAISTKYIDKALHNLGGTERDAIEDTKALEEKLNKFQKVVDEVWNGQWSNNWSDENRERERLFADTEYEFEKVQDLVNRTADGHRLTLEDLNEEELRYLKYTDEEIKQIQTIAKESKIAGTDMHYFMTTMTQKTGRDLLIETVYNTMDGVANYAKAIGQAWRDIFPATTAETIYSIIVGINNLSKKFKDSSNDLDKLKRAAKGVFATIDSIRLILSGPFTLAFKIARTVLSKLGIGILDVAAGVGDAAVAFNGWLRSSQSIFGRIDKWIDKLADFVISIGNMFKSLREGKITGQEFGLMLSTSIYSGIVNGIKWIKEAAITMATVLITTVRKGLGIKSPSREFIEIGKYVIQGLIKGIMVTISALRTACGAMVDNVIKPVMNSIWIVLSNVGDKIKLIFDSIMNSTHESVDGISTFTKNVFAVLQKFASGAKAQIEKLLGYINVDQLISGIIALGGLTASLKFAKSFETISEMFAGVAKTFVDSFALITSGLRKMVGAVAFDKRADGILKLAGAFAILAGSMVLIAVMCKDEATAKGMEKAEEVLVAFVVVIGMMEIAAAALAKLAGPTAALTSVTFISIASAFVALSVAMLIIQKLRDDEDSIKKTVGFMALSVGAMLTIIGFLALLEKHLGNVDKAGVMLLKFASALLVMVFVIKLCGMLKPDDVFTAIVAVTAFSVLFTAVIAVSKLAGANADKAGKMISKMSFAFLMMVMCVKMASSMSETQIAKGMMLVWGMSAIFAAVIAVSIIAGRNAAKAGVSLIGMSGAILIMLLCVRSLNSLTEAELDYAMNAIMRFTIILAMLTATTKLAGTNANKLLSFSVGLSILILSLTTAIYALSFLDEARLKRATISVSILEGLLAVILATSSMMSDAKGAIIAMTVLIGALTVSLVLLSSKLVDPKRLFVASVAIGGIFKAMGKAVVAYSALMKEIMNANSTATSPHKVRNAVLAMTAITGLTIILLFSITAALSMLAKSEGDLSNVKNAASLGIVLGAISLFMKVIGQNINNFSTVSKKEIGAIGAIMLELVATLLAVAGVFKVIEMMNVSSMSLPLLLELTSVMTVFTGLAILLTKFGQMTNARALDGALEAMLVMGAIFIEIGFAFDIITAKPIPIQNILGVILMMATLTGLVILLNKFTGIVNGPGLKAAANAMAWVGVIFYEMAGVLYLLKDIDGGTAIKVSIAIGIMAVALTACSYLLSVVGGLAGPAVAGIAIMGLFAIILGALIENFTTYIGPDLPVLAGYLSDFAKGLMPLVETLGEIDEKVISGAKTLAEMLIALGVADLVNLLTNWLDEKLGEQNIASFSDRIVAFAGCLKEFGEAAKGIDATMVESAANAGMMLVSLENSLPRTGGTLQEWIGTKDIGLFGERMKTFGEKLVEFCEAFKDVDIDKDTIQLAADCGMIMKKFNDNLPSTGGHLQEWLGEQDMATFGSRMVEFAKSLALFGAVIAMNRNVINTDTAKLAADCGSILAALENSLGNIGGVKGFLFGDNDLGKFGDNVKNFGAGISEFSTAAQGIDNEACDKAIVTSEKLVAMSNSLEADKGFLSGFIGDNSMGDFSIQLGIFGEAMATFSNSVEGINDANITAAGNSAEAFGKVLASLPEYDVIKKVNDAGGNTGNLATVLGHIGLAMKTFAKIFSGVNMNTLVSATEQFTKLASAIASLSGVNYTALENFGSSLKELGNDSVKLFANSFSESAEYAEASGAAIGEAIVTAITFKMDSITEAISNGIHAMADYFSSTETRTLLISRVSKLCNSIINTLENRWDDFYDSGRYLTQGFINGMEDTSSSISDKASELARRALESMEKTLDEHSPSKETYRIGAFAGMGFANALTDSTKDVVSASTYMANSAKDSLIDSMSKIGYMIDNDLDLSPVITPVLDLTNVTNGIGSVNGLFRSPTTINGIASISGITRNNSRTDVVDAINALRKDLGNVNNTTYNNVINGMTYDDGSNIVNAMSDLFTAVKMEGRI